MTTRLPSVRRSMLAFLLVALVAAFGWAMLSPADAFQLDFSEYWAAAHLAATGANPYSVREIGAIQHALGSPESRSLMMINPPWTLPLVYWLQWFGFHTAQAIWFVVLLIAAIASSLALWRYFGGERESSWLAIVAALLFVPTLNCLAVGQITPLILLGLTGFLVFESKGRAFLAGCCLLSLCIKPHLLLLVGIAVLLQACDRRRFRVVFGLVTALVLTSVTATIIRPQIWSDYLHLVRSGYVNSYLPALGGTLLRLVFGVRHIWLQFVPTVLGVVWLVSYYWHHRADWRWQERAPAVVIASVVTASYGWSFDEIMLLVGILPAIMAIQKSHAERRWSWLGPLALWIAGDALMFLQGVYRGQEKWKGGTAWLFAAGCWLAFHLARQSESSQRPSVAVFVNRT